MPTAEGMSTVERLAMAIRSAYQKDGLTRDLVQSDGLVPSTAGIMANLQLLKAMVVVSPGGAVKRDLLAQAFAVIDEDIGTKMFLFISLCACKA